MAVLIGAFELGYIKGLRRSDKDTDLVDLQRGRYAVSRLRRLRWRFDRHFE
jgi:hypothetical protein